MKRTDQNQVNREFDRDFSVILGLFVVMSGAVLGVAVWQIVNWIFR